MNRQELYDIYLILSSKHDNIDVKPEILKEFCNNDIWKRLLSTCSLKTAKKLFKYKNDNNYCLIFSIANTKEVVEFVMNNIFYDINETCSTGNNLLHHFVFSSLTYNIDYNVLDLLLELGCDMNCINNEGRTPLMYALMYDKIKIAKKLIEFGANTKIKDKYGMEPKYYTRNKKLFNLL